MLHNTLQTNATQMSPEARGTAVGLFSAALYLGQTAGVAAAAPVIDRYRRATGVRHRRRGRTCSVGLYFLDRDCANDSG